MTKRKRALRERERGRVARYDGSLADHSVMGRRVWNGQPRNVSLECFVLDASTQQLNNNFGSSFYHYFVGARERCRFLSAGRRQRAQV